MLEADTYEAGTLISVADTGVSCEKAELEPAAWILQRSAGAQAHFPCPLAGPSQRTRSIFRA